MLTIQQLIESSAVPQVIIGGSRLEHVQGNLAAAKQGPLPPAVVAAWEEAWAIARPDCPPYFR